MLEILSDGAVKERSETGKLQTGKLVKDKPTNEDNLIDFR